MELQEDSWPAGIHMSPYNYGDAVIEAGYRLKAGERTAYVKCTLPGVFILGRGITIEYADDEAWAQLQAYRACPGHEWQARGYREGTGFCTHCGTTGIKVITAEELGLRCTECGTPTFHRVTGSASRESRCTDHDPRWPYLAAVRQAGFVREDHPEMFDRLRAVADGLKDEDPAALEWARVSLDVSEAG